MDDELRVYRLSGDRYERQASPWFPELRLGLTLWDGVFEAGRHRWLRWVDDHGALIPTGHEQRRRADEQHERADEQHRRAEHAEQLLSEERQRAVRLAELLRRSGEQD